MNRIQVSSTEATLQLTLWGGDSAPVTLALRAAGQPSAVEPVAQPLVELLAVGHGREWAGTRLVETGIGARLRYRSHELRRHGSWQLVTVDQVDDVTGLHVTSELELHDAGLRSTTRVRNGGGEVVTVQAVSSLVFADFGVTSNAELDTMTLLRGRSDWLAEGRWTRQGLRASGLPALLPHSGVFRSRGCIEASSGSSWSTAADAPTVVIAGPAGRPRWSFQVEHNGAWRWQVGELPQGLYVAIFGPTDEHHQWQVPLEPGEEFTTVPAAVTVETGETGADERADLGALTRFRRASRARTARSGEPVGAALPVVFNDYMNTVNGDPTAAVLHPLIDAAADAGADIFVIDAGWYAEDGDWWDTVGEWQPAGHRFPDGIEAVLGHIGRRGMRPGLWLEPEVVGVNSPMADKLPDSAFLTLGGVRVVEHGRFHLDYTSAAAAEFMDEVIDRLVGDLGIAYFKFDYNIRAGVGSDRDQRSAGHGLLRHNRAYLGWVDALRARHPGLVLENCASGGMRADHATVSRFDLQSTSDQEDLLSYAPIAAAAPMLIIPEQVANWAYPQITMSDDEIVFTLCTAMLGRLYLSGWLSRLTGRQQALVAEAVRAHRGLLPHLPESVPFWPLGLPGSDDEWIALGLLGDDGRRAYLTIWHRPATGVGRAATDDRPAPAVLRLPAPPPGHRWAPPTPVFPTTSSLPASLSDSGSVLTVRSDSIGPAARVVSLLAESE